MDQLQEFGLEPNLSYFQFMALTNIVSIQFALTDIFISAIMGAIQGSHWMVFREICFKIIVQCKRGIVKRIN